MASIKLLNQTYELPAIATERFYALRKQLHARQQVIQTGKRPRGWGLLRLGSVNLSHEDYFQELAGLVSDYEAIIAGLQEGKVAYERFFASLAAGVRDAVSSRVVMLRQLEQDRQTFYKSASALQDEALTQLGQQQAEQLLQAVRLLGQAALLLLKKVALCRDGLRKLSDDQTLQQQVLSKLIGHLDTQRPAYELQRRIDQAAREVAQMAEVALQFEGYMREHFGPLQTLLEQVVQADESLHRAVTEIETITQEMLQERSLSFLARTDNVEERWLEFLVSSHIKRDRLADILNRVEREDGVTAELDSTIAVGGSATVLETLDNIETFVDLRLTRLVPEPIAHPTDSDIAQPEPAAHAHPIDPLRPPQRRSSSTAVHAHPTASDVAQPEPAARARPTDPEMVYLPGGRFIMGTENGSEDETPLHLVTLSPFSIGKYPVTFAEYDTFCEATDREKPGDRWGRERRPVIYVSWHDALAYCEWLSEQTGQHYRLPGEAEWEYAARGGTQTTDDFGDNADRFGAYGWYSENSGGTAHPVGGKPPNGLGVYDLSGNVWEWVADWYGAYSSDPANDPTGPSTGYYKVIRGGSYSISIRDYRPTRRGSVPPGSSFRYVGFRLARTP